MIYKINILKIPSKLTMIKLIARYFFRNEVMSVKKSNKNIHIVVVCMLLCVFLLGNSFCSRYTITENIVHSKQALPRVGDTINRLKNIMYNINAESIQGRQRGSVIDEKPEQYRFGNGIRKQMLLFYCLCESMDLLVTAWTSYILISRKNLINYLMAIIYIHKSDGQKEGEHILLNS